MHGTHTITVSRALVDPFWRRVVSTGAGKHSSSKLLYTRKYFCVQKELITTLFSEWQGDISEGSQRFKNTVCGERSEFEDESQCVIEENVRIINRYNPHQT